MASWFLGLRRITSVDDISYYAPEVNIGLGIKVNHRVMYRCWAMKASGTPPRPVPLSTILLPVYTAYIRGVLSSQSEPTVDFMDHVQAYLCKQAKFDQANVTTPGFRLILVRHVRALV